LSDKLIELTGEEKVKALFSNEDLLSDKTFFKNKLQQIQESDNSLKKEEIDILKSLRRKKKNCMFARKSKRKKEDEIE
jgi:hypothetical protein